MQDLNISPAERQAIVEPASLIVERARACLVKTDHDFRLAASSLKEIKAAQKNLDAKKKRLTDPVNATLRAIRDLFRVPEDELATAENLYKRQMLAYEEEQERLRREEQRKLDEQATAERRRLEREAAERQAAAEASRAAGKTAQAERQEAKAEQLSDAAATVVAPVVQREAPRVSGIATRDNWYAIVVDLKELVNAVAAGTVPITALEANMKFLNNQAKAMKRDLAYPGVRPAVDKILASGSK